MRSSRIKTQASFSNTLRTASNYPLNDFQNACKVKMSDLSRGRP
jgi:hypothetical protein